MEGFYRRDDGKIAVLRFDGYGHPWFAQYLSGSGPYVPEALFEPSIVAAVLAGDFDKARAIAEEKWPNGDWRGAKDLVVQWFDEGDVLGVSEYDGNETVWRIDPERTYKRVQVGNPDYLVEVREAVVSRKGP